MSILNKMRLLKSTLCAALIALAWTGSSQATPVTFSGSSGTLSAEADFSLSGSTLTVALMNTSSADVLVPTDVLTGVFFNTTHTLTPVSASLGASTVFYGSISNAGDGWGYASSVSAQGENSAISASGAVSGLGHSNFSGSSNALDGLDYGILSAGDISATGNTGVTGHGPLIKNSIQFTLTAASGFDLSELGDSVVFQYGTALTETHIDGGGGGGGGGSVREPSTLLLLGGGLIGFGAMRRWKA
jgi:hypothetical protein